MKCSGLIWCEKMFWCHIIRKISPQSKSLLITTIDTVKTNCRNRINVRYFLQFQNEHLWIGCKISRVPCIVFSYFTLVFVIGKYYHDWGSTALQTACTLFKLFALFTLFHYLHCLNYLHCFHRSHCLYYLNQFILHKLPIVNWNN